MTRAESNHEVGDERFFRLAGTEGDIAAVAGGLRLGCALHHLGHRADLVGLDQEGVGHALPDAALEKIRIGWT